jgi:hypothetical protein
VAELYDATSWRTVAPMESARRDARLTVLHDGRVLAVGSGSAERYNPNTDAWEPTGAMAGPRFNPAVAKLANGRVLVAGGTASPTAPPTLATTEIYDPVSNTWSAGPDLPTAGAGNAVALPNGRVFVALSAVTGNGTVGYTYDPSTNSWSTASGSLGYQFPALALLKGGDVLLAGGYQLVSPGAGGLITVDDVAVYDVASNSLMSAASLGSARFQHTATTLGDGRVLVSGGKPGPSSTEYSSTEIYDPIADAWLAGPDLGESRSEHSASLLLDGQVLTVAGADAGTAEIASTTASSWSAAGSVLTRSSAGAAVLTNGNVLVAGGFSSVALDSVELYDIGTNFDSDGDGYNDGLELALGQHPWSTCAIMRGDVNYDGVVNSIDFGRVVAKFGLRPPPSRLDQNADTVINSIDQGKLAQQFNQRVLMCP